jgi:NADH-quinone oxidoreductase subunit J
MSAANALFAGFGFIALLSAIGTVVVHSSIRAAMCLLAHIVALSGLFLLLHAELLAALQVLVYAGAVVVLFVFVIMLIGPSVVEPPVLRGMVTKTAATAMVAALTALLAFSLMPMTREAPMIAPCTQEQGAECDQFGGVSAFSKNLYRDTFVPFELISVLLTIAIVGAIAVARGRTPQESASIALKRKQAESAAAAPPTQGDDEPTSPEAATHGGH